MNWSAFELSFIAHLIGYNLKGVFTNDVGRMTKLKKVFSILIVALELSQFVLVNKTSTSAMAWSTLKSFYWKKGGQFVFLFIQKFWHTKMVEGKDLYEHLITMPNLTYELEEVTRTNILDKDFMTKVCFSIMDMPRYSNFVKIIMNCLVLQRADLSNKLTATKQ